MTTVPSTTTVFKDSDGDGVPDATDNCKDEANPGQEDADSNGVGDACQDSDGDGVTDAKDNCPSAANPGQEDADNNNVGDACQDTDGDGILDTADTCPADPDTAANAAAGDTCVDTTTGLADNTKKCCAGRCCNHCYQRSLNNILSLTITGISLNINFIFFIFNILI